MVEDQFLDLGIKSTAGLWELLFDPATKDSQAHRTNTNTKTDFARLLPISPSSKASAAVKEHAKDNQSNGKMNTYGMQQDHESGVKRGHRDAFISPTEVDGQHTTSAEYTADMPPDFLAFHGTVREPISLFLSRC